MGDALERRVRDGPEQVSCRGCAVRSLSAAHLALASPGYAVGRPRARGDERARRVDLLAHAAQGVGQGVGPGRAVGPAQGVVPHQVARVTVAEQLGHLCGPVPGVHR